MVVNFKLFDVHQSILVFFFLDLLNFDLIIAIKVNPKFLTPAFVHSSDT